MSACKICFKNFSTRLPERIPRLLDCKHGYCTECLMKLEDVHGKLLECPKCLYLTKVPEEGVDYLPTDEEIIRKQIALSNIRKCKHCKKLSFPARNASIFCRNCNDYFCGSCSDLVHMKLESMNHFVSLATSSSTSESIRKERLIRSAPSKVLEEREKIKKSHSELEEEKRRCYSCQSNVRKNISEEEEKFERESFKKLHEKMKNCIDDYSDTHKNLLQSMEKLKSSKHNALQVIWQHFQSLRKVIDETEKNVTQEIKNIYSSRLNAMDGQNITMKDRIADAKLLSQNCWEVSKEDIYEFMLQKERLQEKITTVTELLENKMAFIKDEIFVQFPEWETMLSQIRKSTYIVQVTNPPWNLKCSLQQNGDINLTWEPPRNSRFIYPTVMYAIYVAFDDNDSFSLLEKVKTKSCVIPRIHPLLKGVGHAHFKITSINVIGESSMTYPVALKLMKF